MSAALATLLGFAVGFLVLLVDLLVPFEPIAPLDDVERGSTTIMPEDR